MSNLINTQKREWAQLLYINEHISQKEIAERVKVSKVTMNKWVKEGKWDEMKASLTITREEQLKRLYNQIAALNKEIAERETQRYATPAESDTLSKLASAINKMEIEIGLSDIISVSRRFLEWVRRVDIDKAKEFSGLFDGFIKDNLNSI